MWPQRGLPPHTSSQLALPLLAITFKASAPRRPHYHPSRWPLRSPRGHFWWPFLPSCPCSRSGQGRALHRCRGILSRRQETCRRRGAAGREAGEEAWGGLRLSWAGEGGPAPRCSPPRAPTHRPLWRPPPPGLLPGSGPVCRGGRESRPLLVPRKSSQSFVEGEIRGWRLLTTTTGPEIIISSRGSELFEGTGSIFSLYPPSLTP